MFSRRARRSISGKLVTALRLMRWKRTRLVCIMAQIGLALR